MMRARALPSDALAATGLPAAPPPASGFTIQCSVVGALLLRELGARFGRDNIGYLWLFLEPALLGGTIGAVHHFAGHGLPGNLPIMAFWVVGYVPYYMYRSVLNRACGAIVSSQSLLYHRRITLHDLVLARDLLEGAACAGAMAAFIILFALLFGSVPRGPAHIVLGMLMMLALTHGAALLIAAGSIYTDMFDRTIHLFTYLTLPLSGAFFMVFWLPTEMARIVLFIPTVHIFEMVRFGQFGTQVPTTFDIPYVLTWIAVLNLLGLAALRAARRDLVV